MGMSLLILFVIIPLLIIVFVRTNRIPDRDGKNWREQVNEVVEYQNTHKKDLRRHQKKINKREVAEYIKPHKEDEGTN